MSGEPKIKESEMLEEGLLLGTGMLSGGTVRFCKSRRLQISHRYSEVEPIV